MRVVFWGTPEFATPSLRALVGEGFDVVGAVTQPDRPRGRSRSVVDPSPVKQVASAEGIPVLQPTKPREPAFLEQLAALEPDVSVVVAYGEILPRAAIDLPTHGTLNIHGSLLPAYRGAAPIQAAILGGLSETGITIMQMVPALDAGPILHTLTTSVAPDETYGELALGLSELGAEGIVQALSLLSLGALRPQPQDDALATYAPKISRAMARIRWLDSAEQVARGIRAFDPSPGAFTTLGGHDVKLFGARAVPERRGEPGQVIEVEEHGMLIGCGSGAVRVTYVHPAGRRRLAALDWHQGRGVAVGDRFDAGDPPPTAEQARSAETA